MLIINNQYRPLALQSVKIQPLATITRVLKLTKFLLDPDRVLLQHATDKAKVEVAGLLSLVQITP